MPFQIGKGNDEQKKPNENCIDCGRPFYVDYRLRSPPRTPSFVDGILQPYSWEGARIAHKKYNENGRDSTLSSEFACHDQVY